MKRLNSNKRYNLSTAMVTLVIFLISILVILGIRRFIADYKTIAVNDYEIRRIKNFSSVIDGAINLGTSSINDTTARLELEMRNSLDLDTLEDSLKNCKSYPEFEELLRENLQTNVYTKYAHMSDNRNNIFVIANERVIASYTHDGSLLIDGASLGSKVNIRETIETNFYNTELSIDAVDKIVSQNNGLIIWQSRDPNNTNIPKYKAMSRSDLIDVFKRNGVDGLDSYEILIPSYITGYGNIFGEYDVPGETSADSNNKIIIIQKLNLADYIKCNFPNLFDDSIEDMVYKFDKITMMINILIILDCASMIAYALVFVSMYNHKILLETGIGDEEAKN